MHIAYLLIVYLRKRGEQRLCKWGESLGFVGTRLVELLKYGQGTDNCSSCVSPTWPELLVDWQNNRLRLAWSLSRLWSWQNSLIWRIRPSSSSFLPLERGNVFYLCMELGFPSSNRHAKLGWDWIGKVIRVTAKRKRFPDFKFCIDFKYMRCFLMYR